MRVASDRTICMGTGMCVMTAGDFFDQDDDGIVVLASGQVPDGLADDAERRIEMAVNLCPSGALMFLAEDNGSE